MQLDISGISFQQLFVENSINWVRQEPMWLITVNAKIEKINAINVIIIKYVEKL